MLEREQKLIQEKRVLEERVKNLEEELGKQIQLNKDMAAKVRLIEAQIAKPAVVSTIIQRHQRQTSTQLTGALTSQSFHVKPVPQINPLAIKRARH